MITTFIHAKKKKPEKTLYLGYMDLWIITRNIDQNVNMIYSLNKANQCQERQNFVPIY